MKKIIMLCTLCVGTVFISQVEAQKFRGLDKSPMDAATYPGSYRVSDKTVKIINKIKKRNRRIKIVNNIQPGLGSAIKVGIKKSINDYVCIYMADESDSIKDMVKYYNIINKNKLDAVFGSRFIKGSNVKNYPIKKLFFNRIFNNICKIFFFNSYNAYNFIHK